MLIICIGKLTNFCHRIPGMHYASCSHLYLYLLSYILHLQDLVEDHKFIDWVGNWCVLQFNSIIFRVRT